jgi:hypothetical protein
VSGKLRAPNQNAPGRRPLAKPSQAEFIFIPRHLRGAASTRLGLPTCSQIIYSTSSKIRIRKYFSVPPAYRRLQPRTAGVGEVCVLNVTATSAARCYGTGTAVSTPSWCGVGTQPWETPTPRSFMLGSLQVPAPLLLSPAFCQLPFVSEFVSLPRTPEDGLNLTRAVVSSPRALSPSPRCGAPSPLWECGTSPSSSPSLNCDSKLMLFAFCRRSSETQQPTPSLPQLDFERAGLVPSAGAEGLLISIV